MTEQTEVKLITPGVIAEKLKVPLHQVLYILSTRSHIIPAARAGTLRLYHKEALSLVRHELNAIAARKMKKGVNHAK
ncbi:hypothetical protein ACFL02_03970 [Planctomycetota bacterium]